MKDEQTTYHTIRRHLMGELYVGGLQPGDRLPSIRDVARRTGTDHRAVARAYRRLAEEGLVDVRDRSGVVVSGQRGASDGARSHTDLLCAFVEDAWQRRIPLRALGVLVARATAHGLRCLVVESNEDHETALGAELAEDFNFDVVALRVPAAGGLEAIQTDRLADAIQAADLVVTTAFHALQVTPIARACNKPIVAASVHAHFRRDLMQALNAGFCTVVISDPAYAERARTHLRGFSEGSHFRFAHVETEDVAPFADALGYLFTRAARRRLGLDEFHLIRDRTFLSGETARQLARVIVDTNLGTGA